VKPPELTEDERITLTVRQLLKRLQQFGRPPVKVIPWPTGASIDKGRPWS